MGAKSSKKVIPKKPKNQEHYEQRLQTLIYELSNKLNDEGRKKVHLPGFCNELKMKLKQKYEESVAESIREEKEKSKEVLLPINMNETQIQFQIQPLNEIKSYRYGCPSTATISMLNSYMHQNEHNQMVTFVLKDENSKVIKVEQNLLIQNSEHKSFESPKLVRDCSLQSIQSILICLFTQKLYLSINTFNEILRLCSDLKITVILQFMTTLFDDCDPICTLAKLREAIDNYKTDNIRNYIRIIYEVNKNLSKILKHPAIVDLTFEEIKEIAKLRPEIRSYLSLDERNELLVFYAIIDWILHDTNSRYQRNLQLLPLVQFDKMTLEQWREAFNPQLLLSFPENLQHLMFEIHDYYVANDTSGKFSVLDVYLTLPKFEKEVIDEKVEKFDITPTVGKKFDNNETAEIKQSQSIEIDEKAKKVNKSESEELEELARVAVRSFKNLGTQVLKDLPDSKDSNNHSFDVHSIILLVGGYQSQVSYKTEQGLFMHQFKPFGCCTNKHIATSPKISDYVWSPLSQRLPKTLAHFASLKMGSLVFLIGGIDVSKLLHEKTLHPINECSAYSLANDDWYKIAPMHFSRGYHGAVCIGDKIFVFGGISLISKQLTLTNTIEIFDIRKNIWSEIIPGTEKPCPRAAFGMVYYQEVVWIIGGLSQLSVDYCYESGDLLSDVWIFSVQHQQWTSVEFWRLPRPRAFMTTVIFRNQIFVIGGHEVEDKYENDESSQRTLQDTRTNSVFIFRDVKSAWEEGPPLHFARIYATATVVENVLFVIGGITCNHKHINEPILGLFSGSYEVYNPDINPNWVENSMVFSLYAGNAITVKSSIEKPNTNRQTNSHVSVNDNIHKQTM
ncbi:ring canal kelch-like protein [Leptotrombidium deliense]|uniref:Ring canal kelch-like protein n=1 Tax=Leptotrombidium deliense TaxID=299467 RepID=A0A443SWG8_9ACAR|nr:ring canal kelch-like protein [Leptotrombidium deliense]